MAHILLISPVWEVSTMRRIRTQSTGFTNIIVTAAALNIALLSLAGCQPEPLDCMYAGTLYGGGQVEFSMGYEDDAQLTLQADGIDEALIDEEGEDSSKLTYDSQRMGSSAAFARVHGFSTLVEAHFAWPGHQFDHIGGCAMNATELAFAVQFPNELDEEGVVTIDSWFMTGTGGNTIASDWTELPVDAVWTEADERGGLQADLLWFPHIVDCLGGPDLVDMDQRLWIDWEFDPSICGEDCYMLGLD